MRTALTVYAKELRDALRDRRTLVAVLFSSVIIGPLVLAMLSALVGRYQQQAEAREVVTVGLDRAPTLRNYIARQTFVARPAPADWEARLKADKLGEPVLVIPPDFEDRLAHGEAPTLQLVYSSANGRAQGGVGRIEGLLQGFQQEQATLRLIARGVAPGMLAVAQVDEHDIADTASRAAQLTGMLPYFVLMAVVYGALNAALDSTAGERERGSLEPLLVTPAPRGALVVGKWAAVASVGILIALMSCLSFLPSQWLVRSESLAALFRFGWREAAAFVALLVPLAATLSALMMAIAIRSRTVKEAQANNVVLTLAISLLPTMSFFNDSGEAAWNLWIPGIAQTTLMNRVLKDLPIGAADVLPSLAVCAGLTVGALAFVKREMARRAVQ